MELLKLTPAIKSYIWGGQKLKQNYNINCENSIVAESWMLSAHHDGPSIIENGVYAGKTLSEYLSINSDAIGINGKTFEQFPLLIKLIDAKDNLSVQVHPDNEYALIHEKEYGKTEVWYILEADENSHLYFGTKSKITKDQLRQFIKEKTLTNYLKAVPVKKGQVFFIKAGTIHAVGKGIVLCEIQQNSNSTYRLFDYGRKNSSGKERPLHIEKGVDVANLSPIESDFNPEGAWEEHTGSKQALISKTDYFNTSIIKVSKVFKYIVDNKSFVSLVFIDGQAKIESSNLIVDAKKGDSYFAPAGYGEITIVGQCQLILTKI